MATSRPTHRSPCPYRLLALMLGCLLGLGMARPASAQDVLTVRGQVGQTLGFFLQDGSRSQVGNGGNDDISWTPGQVALNRTHYQLQFERRFGWDAAGLISLKGHWDAGVGGLQALVNVANGETSSLLELDQAYVDLYSDTTDFRLGRQRIAWGTADGFNPTSYFAPLSLDLTGGLEGLVQPVSALRASTYFNVGTLGLVVVPTFERRADWKCVLHQALAQFDEELGAPEGEEPKNHGEIGLQFDTFYRGTSLYLSYFNGYEDQPAAWILDQGPGLEAKAEWRREQKLGLALATTWQGFTLWSEGTYTLPARLAGLEGLEPSRILAPTKPYVTAVLGADYLFPSGVRAELQYLYNGRGSLLQVYEPSDAPAGQYLMGLTSIPLSEDHTLEFLALDSLQDESLVFVPTYRYQLTPTTQASLSLILVHGGETSEVGQADLDDLDQLTLAVTVRF